MNKTYSVKTFVIVSDIGKAGNHLQGEIGIRNTEIIKNGLTWQAAKELRNTNKGSWISNENNKY